MALGLTGGHHSQDLRRVPGTCVFLYPQAWEVPNVVGGGVSGPRCGGPSQDHIVWKTQVPELLPHTPSLAICQ